MVELELKMEVKEDIRAANITASIKPRTPDGSNSLTNLTNAKFVQPALKIRKILEWCLKIVCRSSFSKLSWAFYSCIKQIENKSNHLDPHILSHSSGLAQATSSGKSALAAIPGNTINHKGSSLREEAKTQPALAWTIVLAAKALCTITWSEHQYHKDEIVNPKTICNYYIIVGIYLFLSNMITPLHGRSESCPRKRCIESWGTSPQKPWESSPGTFRDRLEAVALKYISTKFSYPSTCTKAKERIT